MADEVYDNILNTGVALAAGYSGNLHQCSDNDCGEATVIMIEKCCEMSVFDKIARTDVNFGRDGKLKIREEDSAMLKPMQADGKMTPCHWLSRTYRRGFLRSWYCLLKESEHYKSLSQCDDIDKTRVLNKLIEKLYMQADRYLLNFAGSCGTSANTNCSSCETTTGSAATPIPISLSNMDDAAEAFRKFLIDMKNQGRMISRNCPEKMVIFMNSCSEILVDYMDASTTHCCTIGNTLPEGLRPKATSVPNIEVFFRDDVPAGEAWGMYANDVALAIDPPVVHLGRTEAQSDGVYDQFRFTIRGADIRNDRKWKGYYTLSA